MTVTSVIKEIFQLRRDNERAIRESLIPIHSGATEQLDKLRFVPIYVRSFGDKSPGLDALRKKGALPWPDPQDVDTFETVFDVANIPAKESPQSGLSLFSHEAPSEASPVDTDINRDMSVIQDATLTVSAPETNDTVAELATTPADVLFSAVRKVIQQLLKAPMKDTELAARKPRRARPPQVSKYWTIRYLLFHMDK